MKQIVVKHPGKAGFIASGAILALGAVAYLLPPRRR